MSKPNIKSGTVREDGKVFWRYHPNCKNGEHWVTELKYLKWREGARKREKQRYREHIKPSPEARLRRAEAMRRYRARLRTSGPRTPQPRTEDPFNWTDGFFEALRASEAYKLGIPVSELPDSYSKKYFESRILEANPELSLP